MMLGSIETKKCLKPVSMQLCIVSHQLALFPRLYILAGGN